MQWSAPPELDGNPPEPGLVTGRAGGLDNRVTDFPHFRCGASRFDRGARRAPSRTVPRTVLVILLMCSRRRVSNSLTTRRDTKKCLFGAPGVGECDTSPETGTHVRIPPRAHLLTRALTPVSGDRASHLASRPELALSRRSDQAAQVRIGAAQHMIRRGLLSMRHVAIS